MLSTVFFCLESHQKDESISISGRYRERTVKKRVQLTPSLNEFTINRFARNLLLSSYDWNRFDFEMHAKCAHTVNLRCNDDHFTAHTLILPQQQTFELQIGGRFLQYSNARRKCQNLTLDTNWTSKKRKTLMLLHSPPFDKQRLSKHKFNCNKW